MITRRSVRIKTMQYIYAFESSENVTLSSFQIQLEKSIAAVSNQYIFCLLAIREIANFVEKDAQVKQAKFIKTTADKNFNTKLLSNIFIQYLNGNQDFLKSIKELGYGNIFEEETIRRWYKILAENEKYKLYLSTESEFNYEDDKRIIDVIWNDILLQDDIFLDTMEDTFANWIDDAPQVTNAINEVIYKSKNELKLHINKEQIKSKFKELFLLGSDLFVKTIDNKDKYYKFIEPKLKNWDADRLATIDLILMRMAITEFINFPSIPTKVTINEYLDIAKEYSTPKSKDFINGILDSLMKTFTNDGTIQKLGRGLI